MKKPTRQQLEDAYYAMQLAKLDWKDNSGSSNADEFYMEYSNKYDYYARLHKAYKGNT